MNPQSFPPPPAWYAPQPPPSAPRPVTFGQMWAFATPGVMICLLMGTLLPVLAIPLMFVAHALAARVQHRRRQISTAFRVVEGSSALIALTTMLLDFGAVDLSIFWENWTGWAMLGNAVLAVACLLIAGAGVRAGEPPERSSYP